MATIDLTPLYRSTIGFDRMASILDAAMRTDTSNGYPPYNIEALEENRYQISLAVAGFDEKELDLEVERGVLTVRGRKADEDGKQYLHKGIAFRSFERKFNLADYVQVEGATLKNGLLVIQLLKVIPEQMKARRIPIGEADLRTIESDGNGQQAA
ncbi:MAG: Hsp20 family protein [Gammaproteobacteria bacterium]|uniref:Hsp20 family protein n=1 Tax=Limnobacter sp. TaxID=2003368 RepID=UPI001D341E56|nr:Hsp20 family protein [Limnobacter sp.]MBU0783128.1 Hsp20 family protein [Gammaproteobacteria bacterium]MBU0849715.1 Hsp20 family protein [Gammaproteobacteria bacterium]MBU1266166.1 Hsp20 family protein [Gammaproteobacteria bacterium]MBU1529357.1 Hsp20 family protein [Gammaproteobacteria bacterium]MBU1779264.1 Hsp20 family protein [Gammaproteobacteria bacterium]